MCSIVAMAAVGTAMQAYGQYQQGQAAKSQGDYNAAIARNNAIIAERQAADAVDRGRTAELRHRQQIQQLKGQQRVGFGASGVTLDSESVVDVLGDTAEFGELDALTIRNNAAREAYGYRVQGSNFETEARMATYGGKAAQNASMLGIGGSLLTGASTVAGINGGLYGGTGSTGRVVDGRLTGGSGRVNYKLR